MGALFFAHDAGRISVLLNHEQRPFRETARLLLRPDSRPNSVVSTVVLLLQGGLLQSDCQQMQALYLLSVASRASSTCTAVLAQAAACEAASIAVRALALRLLAEGAAAVARLTPQEFLQTFDPGVVLSAPTLLELQLAWLRRGSGGCAAAGPTWQQLPDASAVRAAALPPEQAAALRELLMWAAAGTLAGGGDGTAVDIACRAGEVLQGLHSWAGLLASCWQHGACLACDQVAADLAQQQKQSPGDTVEPAGAVGQGPRQTATPAGQPYEPSPQPQQHRAEAEVGGRAANGDACTLPGSPPRPASAGASGASSSGATPVQDYRRLRQLLGQAQRFPLLPGDCRELVAGLKGDAGAVVACQADLNEYRGLIENNPLVAAWLVISINWHNQRSSDPASGAAFTYQEQLEVLSKSIPNYLAVLCTLPMTNHSMECMTTLVDCAPPPPTVLAVFVANCIRTIDVTQDASRQARLAKLLCAFLQHLFDREQEDVVPAVYADVQAFCIAWSRLKEAAALFKRLRALEGGGGGESELLAGGGADW